MDRRQFVKNAALVAGFLGFGKPGMSSSKTFKASPISLKTNGLVFDGLAAGPKSGRLILLLHGFPQFADSWTTVMAQLTAAGYCVIAVNQRGYSKGARPPLVSDYALTDLVSDAMGFADAAGARRFHLAVTIGEVP